MAYIVSNLRLPHLDVLRRNPLYRPRRVDDAGPGGARADVDADVVVLQTRAVSSYPRGKQLVPSRQYISKRQTRGRRGSLTSELFGSQPVSRSDDFTRRSGVRLRTSWLRFTRLVAYLSRGMKNKDSLKL